MEPAARGHPPPEGSVINSTPPGADAPLAIEARDLEKTFRIPTHKVDSLKERVLHPFSTGEVRELRALDGVSFEIRQGEFFAIVGRNGSGKSTLLKLLASIYRADAGSIRMAGTLAPFIELGVGFNMDLTARENVVLNGVMMGMTPQQMRRRLDAVIEFAELEEFVELKLKNYSSGMLVRLAFSTMLQANADVMLIDEVLAVGDAAFQQKCVDAFHALKSEGKTIVLVTHEMSAVEEYCHRAMLIDGGRIQHIGDPGEVGRRYLELNFERGRTLEGESAFASSDEVRILGAWLEDHDGNGLTNVEQGRRVVVRTELEALRDGPGYNVAFSLTNADGIGIFQVAAPALKQDHSTALSAGERIEVRLEFENLLVSGRYFVHMGVNRHGGAGVALYSHGAVDFVVFGGEAGGRALVDLPHEIEARIAEGSVR